MESSKNCRIGVYICMCGTNIAKVVDVEAVAESVSAIPDVVLAKTYKYMCSNPGQEMIVQDIKENHLNRVVVAACSPNMHERTFRSALRSAGLNQYLFEMANIREQCSWVHKDPEEATLKAKELITAAISRVKFHEELESMSVNMCPNVLVIGGGIAGMTAALELADAGNFVYLVEKNDHLGGNLARVDLTAPYLYSARDLLTERITRIMNHKQVQVLFKSKLEELTGFIGNFKAKIGKYNGSQDFHSDQIDVEIGNVVVCTGFKEFDAARIVHYGYGKLPNVITSFELERMIRADGLSQRREKYPNMLLLFTV
jgi:heterodisulfide reductase subunit A